MATDGQRALSAAVETRTAARAEVELALREAEAAWDRLQASPDTIEYQINWNIARRNEAAAVARARQAERDYMEAGGYALTDSED